ncbi:BnaA05g13200D [Brassica napus]|uniref:BnaA05g13200D protein n=1 Tax=Brassica napus TaxID=3708 RepID=A0A078F008_BRANA|nr:BnaA05g13200D [Brassica napus]
MRCLLLYFSADKIESKPCRDLERLGNSSRQASLFFSLFLSDASLLAVRLISPCRAAAGGGGGRVVWWTVSRSMWIWVDVYTCP